MLISSISNTASQNTYSNLLSTDKILQNRVSNDAKRNIFIASEVLLVAGVATAFFFQLFILASAIAILAIANIISYVVWIRKDESSDDMSSETTESSSGSGISKSVSSETEDLEKISTGKTQEESTFNPAASNIRGVTNRNTPKPPIEKKPLDDKKKSINKDLWNQALKTDGTVNGSEEEAQENSFTKGRSRDRSRTEMPPQIKAKTPKKDKLVVKEGEELLDGLKRLEEAEKKRLETREKQKEEFKKDSENIERNNKSKSMERPQTPQASVSQKKIDDEERALPPIPTAEKSVVGAVKNTQKLQQASSPQTPIVQAHKEVSASTSETESVEEPSPLQKQLLSRTQRTKTHVSVKDFTKQEESRSPPPAPPSRGTSTSNASTPVKHVKGPSVSLKEKQDKVKTHVFGSEQGSIRSTSSTPPIPSTPPTPSTPKTRDPVWNMTIDPDALVDEVNSRQTMTQGQKHEILKNLVKKFPGSASASRSTSFSSVASETPLEDGLKRDLDEAKQKLLKSQKEVEERKRKQKSNNQSFADGTPIEQSLSMKKEELLTEKEKRSSLNSNGSVSDNEDDGRGNPDLNTLREKLIASLPPLPPPQLKK